MKPLFAIVFALALVMAGAGLAAPVRGPHLTAELVAARQSVAPGGDVVVAVVLTADKGWHTYWRNPGDAGEATTIRWTLPAGWRAGDIVWPPPQRLPVGPLMNYGYEGRVLLASPLQAVAGARIGDRAAIAAAVDYLVCAEVCVPGSANLKLDLPVVAGAPQPDPHWATAIATDLAKAPTPAGLAAAFERTGPVMKLAVAGTLLAGVNGADGYFYPFDDTLIDQAKAETVERGPRGLTLSMTPGRAFDGAAAPARAAGVLEVDGKAFAIDATPGPPPPGASGLGPPAPKTSARAVLLAMALAFAGGVLLNLMPCVFPILSMKALALARHGADGASARRGAVAYGVGVVASFIVLACVLIAARAGGSAIGWGFQLQSPRVVAALGLVMFAAALNLSGLFEVGSSIQGVGSGLAARRDLLGAALTGALAVVVAAPCTAPFMGPALGYALTQPASVALAVFVALALGFAAPFVLLGFSPGLIHRLPAPGPWMETTRRILAFPLYASAAWLAWVLAQQSGPDGLACLLAAFVVTGLAAWTFGLSQRAHLAGGSAGAPLLVALIASLIGIGLVIAAPSSPSSAPLQASSGPTFSSERFSPERLTALRDEGRPVLVNFTAAWCVTCQVNERLALSSPAIAQAFRRSGAAYLVADWTNRDAVIARALADQGRVGVPLYLLYGAGAAKPTSLPQILTPAIVVAALDGAAVRPRGPAAR
jgi:thiol:disulfide interchange protein DsbD